MKSKRSKACDIPMSVKRDVWERDNHCCVVCGKPVPIKYANAHYIPRSKGGLGIKENVATACFECHFREHNAPDGQKVHENIGKHLHKCYPDMDERTLYYSKEGV